MIDKYNMNPLLLYKLASALPYISKHLIFFRSLTNNCGDFVTTEQILCSFGYLTFFSNSCVGVPLPIIMSISISLQHPRKPAVLWYSRTAIFLMVLAIGIIITCLHHPQEGTTKQNNLLTSYLALKAK